MTDALRYTMLGLSLLVAGCALNAEKGKTTQGLGGRNHEQKVVKTTAYTDSESGHRRYGVKNAIGSHLQSGSIHSAAADWSHFPLGTKFRIVDNDKTYVVDDYGSAGWHRFHRFVRAITSADESMGLAKSDNRGA